ncbi:MAG: hypothetical protein ISP90_01620 [Nevskia sp.]|nr:hypothetical protein [Nevskia sp.]
MRAALSMVLGVVLAINGIAMLAAGQTWYQLVPTVPDTGPYNPHFVHDIGCAYLAAAFGMLWLARDRLVAWPAALAGAVFQALHALTHVWDLAAGRETPLHFAIDIVLVVAPAALALWLAWPPLAAARARAGSP